MVFQTIMDFSSLLHHALWNTVQHCRGRKPSVRSSGRLVGQSGVSCIPLPVMNATIYMGCRGAVSCLMSKNFPPKQVLPCVQHKLREAGSFPNGRGYSCIDCFCGCVPCRLVDFDSTLDLNVPKFSLPYASMHCPEETNGDFGSRWFWG